MHFKFDSQIDCGLFLPTDDKISFGKFDT